MSKYSLCFYVGEIIFRLFPLVVIPVQEYRGYYTTGGEWLLYLFANLIWYIGFTGMLSEIKDEFYRLGRLTGRKEIRRQIEDIWLNL